MQTLARHQRQCKIFCINPIDAITPPPPAATQLSSGRRGSGALSAELGSSGLFFTQAVQVISPCLHHLPTLWQVLCTVVCRFDGISSRSVPTAARWHQRSSPSHAAGWKPYFGSHDRSYRPCHSQGAEARRSPCSRSSDHGHSVSTGTHSSPCLQPDQQSRCAPLAGATMSRMVQQQPIFRGIPDGIPAKPKMKKALEIQGLSSIIWRRGGDSNPRGAINACLISSQVHSTTLPPLRVVPGGPGTRIIRGSEADDKSFRQTK